MFDGREIDGLKSGVGSDICCFCCYCCYYIYDGDLDDKLDKFFELNS